MWKMRLYLYLIKHNAIKIRDGVDVYLRLSLTSVLDRSEWSDLDLGRLTSGNEPTGTHWMGSSADLDLEH